MLRCLEGTPALTIRELTRSFAAECAGDGLEEGGGAFGLKDEGHFDAAGDADGVAMVLGYGDGDHGIDEDLFLA